MATATLLEDEIAVSPAQRERLPSLDGHGATRLLLKFSGAGELDPLSNDDIELLEAARLGSEVRLLVVGEVSTKGFRLNRKPGDDEIAYTCVVHVLAVEGGEIA